MRRTFPSLRRAWLSTKSPHAILGVAQGASAEDLKQAYRKKAMHLHPDRHDGDEAAVKELSQAYASLASENVPLTPEEAEALFFQLFGADGDFGALWRVDGRSQRKAKSWQDYQALLDTGDSTAVTSGREARQLYRECLRALRGVDDVTADGVRAHARSLFALHADETDLTLLRNLLVDGRASLDEMISCLGTAVAEPPPPPSTPRRATAAQGAAFRVNGAARGFATARAAAGSARRSAACASTTRRSRSTRRRAATSRSPSSGRGSTPPSRRSCPSRTRWRWRRSTRRRCSRRRASCCSRASTTTPSNSTPTTRAARRASSTPPAARRSPLCGCRSSARCAWRAPSAASAPRRARRTFCRGRARARSARG